MEPLSGRRIWDKATTLWLTGRIARLVPLEDGDTRVLYELGQEPAPTGKVDSLGRTALEAFTAIPFDALVGRLDAGADVPGRPRTDFPELAAFVHAFGPIGVEWGLEFRIGEMPRLAGEPTDPRTRGPIDELTQSVSGPHQYWVVKLDWLGPGRTGRAHLGRRHELPDADARARARYDDSLPSDRISRLAAERGTLERLIDLADAIATGNRLAAKLAAEAVPGLVDLGFPLGSRSGPSGWATAHIGPLPFDGTWRPGRKGHGVDWFALGRLWLAAAIDQRLNFTKTTVVADRGGIRSLDRATSLLEVIYRQLLQQVEQRPDFGFGRCAYCGGRVIRTRRPGPRANRWHPGCKETGRKRELRRRSTREVS